MRHTTVLVITAAMAIASCSSGTTDATDAAVEAAPSTTASTVTTTVPVTTTTVEEATTTTAASQSGATIAKDIVYLEMNGDEYLVDVYVPSGEGPWPVVVALHGGTVYKGESGLTTVAKAAAEAGLLTFVPNWVAHWPRLSAMTAEFVRSTQLALECSLAFAQQEAAGYGGDAGRTVVYGYSAGATSGAGLVLGPAAELPPGCLAQVQPTTPVGVVFGDAEYFFHAGWWDEAFNADAEAMQKIVAETVDPRLWRTDLPARIRLSAAEAGSFVRGFDDPWDEDGWFALRDPEGTIRNDLDDLGELDDGLISYIDEGLLLFTRLEQTGIDATFDILPGGHSASGIVDEIVAYLLDAAGTA